MSNYEDYLLMTPLIIIAFGMMIVGWVGLVHVVRQIVQNLRKRFFLK